MITEDYVSFKTACLLKDKGFDQKCEKIYMQGELKSASCCMEGESSVDREDIRLAANYENWIEYTQGDYAVLAPTLNIALKWLREVHKKNINIIYDLQKFSKTDGSVDDVEVYEVDIITKNGTFYIGNYNHYESAAEAAIQYCLTNLIK